MFVDPLDESIGFGTAGMSERVQNNLNPKKLRCPNFPSPESFSACFFRTDLFISFCRFT